MIWKVLLPCLPFHSWRVTETENHTGVSCVESWACSATPRLFKYWEMTGHQVRLYSLCTVQQHPALVRGQWCRKCSLFPAGHASCLPGGKPSPHSHSTHTQPGG